MSYSISYYNNYPIYSSIYVDELDADDIVCDTITANSGNITNLTSTDITTNTITSNDGTFNNLSSVNITTDNLTSTDITTNDLTVSNDTTLNNLTVSNDTTLNNLTVSNDTTLKDLTVSNDTTLKDLTVSNDTTLNNLTVNYTANFLNEINVSRDINCDKDIYCRDINVSRNGNINSITTSEINFNDTNYTNNKTLNIDEIFYVYNLNVAYNPTTSRTITDDFYKIIGSNGNEINSVSTAYYYAFTKADIINNTTTTDYRFYEPIKIDFLNLTINSFQTNKLYQPSTNRNISTSTLPSYDTTGTSYTYYNYRIYYKYYDTNTNTYKMRLLTTNGYNYVDFNYYKINKYYLSCKNETLSSNPKYIVNHINGTTNNTITQNYIYKCSNVNYITNEFTFIELPLEEKLIITIHDVAYMYIKNLWRCINIGNMKIDSNIIRYTNVFRNNENFNLSNTASGIYSHAEGYNTRASGSYSHAEGFDTKATNSYSHSEGASTTASGSYSHSEGYLTTASGSYSHSGGYYTTADKNYMTAIGKYNIYNSSDTSLNNNKLFVVGNGTSTSARSDAFVVKDNGDTFITNSLYGGNTFTHSGIIEKSIISGEINTITNITNSLISGFNNNISDCNNVIINGNNNILTQNGNNSLIIGNNNKITKDGYNSLIMGNNNINSSGDNNLITGNNNNCSSGDNNLITGQGHITSNDNQTLLGKYSDNTDINNLLVIGNGTNINNRSNALRLTNTGDLYLNDLYLNNVNFKKIINDLMFPVDSVFLIFYKIDLYDTNSALINLPGYDGKPNTITNTPLDYGTWQFINNVSEGNLGLIKISEASGGALGTSSIQIEHLPPHSHKGLITIDGYRPSGSGGNACVPSTNISTYGTQRTNLGVWTTNTVGFAKTEGGNNVFVPPDTSNKDFLPFGTYIFGYRKTYLD